MQPKKAFVDGWYLTGISATWWMVNSISPVAKRPDHRRRQEYLPADLELLAYAVPGVHAGRASASAFSMTPRNRGCGPRGEVDATDPMNNRKSRMGFARP